MIEYRICWSASSNVNFHGKTDWREWDEDGATAEGVADALNDSNPGTLAMGLEEALDTSGFEWWAETREAGND